MIISDTHKFAFVHIPKCAGTTVKAANPTIDNVFSKTLDNHNILGSVDLSHLPLWAMRDHFPSIFEKIVQFRSFAVSRDPIERFGSSVMQRCRQHLDFEASDISADVLVKSAHEAISFLSANPNSLDPEFVHFIPQSRYILLEGETIVQSVDLSGAFSKLNAFLESRSLNLVGTTTRKNASVEPASETLSQFLNVVRPLYRAILPKQLKTMLWLKLIDAGLYAPQPNRYASLLDDKDVMIFIDDFYAEDFEIYRKALAQEKGRAEAA